MARPKSRAAIEERIVGRWNLDDERWRGHEATHRDLARNLTEYKSESNEWRSTVSDLRATFLTKNEFDAEHRALKSDMVGETKALEAIENSNRDRITALESAKAARDAADLVQASSRSELQRRDDANRARSQWMIGIAVAVISIVVSAFVAILIRIVTG
jgi:peptidoglycan hydrolase CwlO-like protein